MKLLFDIGNSALKWGWLDGEGALHFGGRLDWPTRPDAVLAQLDERLEGAEVHDTLVANVGPRPALYPLLAALNARFGHRPRLVFSEPACCGVENGYADFSQLGVDRWLALIAARVRLPQRKRILVVMAGTAVTADLLEGAQHQGGMIAPGPALMRRCLAGQTANLAQAAASSPPTPVDTGLARTTRDAIEAGVHYMAAAHVQALYTDLRAAGPLALVLGGGLAPRLADVLDVSRLELARDLVLEGLAEVARVNG